MNSLRQIGEPLMKWYQENKRVLPWRDQNNAYYTWVSEIMLQQTRVEAVKPYFQRFMEELPDIEALARCPEEKLLKLWEGLGYYNRVRNMQKAAQEVMEKYGGQLPRNYELLRELKGIGNYTAGAIASIAYEIAVPAVDGNVLRVISRVTENGGDIRKQSVKRQIEEELREVIPREKPGDFNQALMELGAVICVPNGQAKCQLCPIREFCQAHAHGREMDYPKKAAKKPRAVQKKTILVIQDDRSVAIRRRPSRGLLAGLYELPNLDGWLAQEEILKYLRELELEPLRILPIGEAKHVFSHVEWWMRGYQVRVASVEQPLWKELIFVKPQETAEQYAIPSAFDVYANYLKEEKIR